MLAFTSITCGDACLAIMACTDLEICTGHYWGQIGVANLLVPYESSGCRHVVCGCSALAVYCLRFTLLLQDIIVGPLHISL